MRAWWHSYEDESGEEAIDSADAAADFFRRVDANQSIGRVLVDFIHDNGAALTAGAGADWSVLNYQDSLDPPYFWTVGDAPEAPDLLDFSYGGSYSEYERRQLVQKTAAEAAIREFVTTGRRRGIVKTRGSACHATC